LLAWTTDVGAYFDYGALIEQGCVDLFLDMAYCWCVDYESHSSTRNRAPTPMPFIDEIITTYETKFKVPASKLGVIFPWYACSFECSGEGDAYGGCPFTPKIANGFFPPLYGAYYTHLICGRWSRPRFCRFSWLPFADFRSRSARTGNIPTHYLPNATVSIYAFYHLKNPHLYI
jgi:hypothetical protein